MNAMLTFAGTFFLVVGTEPIGKPQDAKSEGQVTIVVATKTVSERDIEAVGQALKAIRKGIDDFEGLIQAQGKRVSAYQVAIQKARCDAHAWARKMAEQRDEYKRNPPQCPDERKAYESRFCEMVADCADRQKALDKWSKAVSYAKLALMKCNVQVDSMRKQSEIVNIGIGELDALFTGARIVEASLEATKIQAELDKLQGNMANMAQGLLGELKKLETELSKRVKSEPSRQFRHASAQLDSLLETAGK